MVFSSSDTRQWFIDTGRQAVSAVIESAGKVHEISENSATFLVCYIHVRTH